MGFVPRKTIVRNWILTRYSAKEFSRDVSSAGTRSLFSHAHAELSRCALSAGEGAALPVKWSLDSETPDAIHLVIFMRLR